MLLRALRAPGVALVIVSVFGLSFAVEARAAKPQPVGMSTTTFSYETGSGVVSYSGMRDYTGIFPADATALGSAPNIKTFNSVNNFGRRLQLAASHPDYADIIGTDESMMAHAFFKNDVGGDYFPGIAEGSDLTINIEGIHFDQPVMVDTSTFLFHTLWNGDQADQLPNFYHHLHNMHTQSDPFRDQEDFHAGGLFAEHPEPNFLLGDVAPVFTGLGTDTLGVTLTVPYDTLKSLEEEGQSVPGGLPAPWGFLEPFHFHIEYGVSPVPEPATLMLLGFGAIAMIRRR